MRRISRAYLTETLEVLFLGLAFALGRLGNVPKTCSAFVSIFEVVHIVFLGPAFFFFNTFNTFPPGGRSNGGRLRRNSAAYLTD